MMPFILHSGRLAEEWTAVTSRSLSRWFQRSDSRRRAASQFLVMVFVLQHTKMRQQAAVQRKLDEILRVLPGADQRLLHLETAPQAELDALDERHGTVRDEALVDPATAK